VASIIERIDLGCASNLMRVLISLTAPAWVVRNMIILDLGILVIGWVLGIAIMRQAERSVAMWEDGVE